MKKSWKNGLKKICLLLIFVFAVIFVAYNVCNLNKKQVNNFAVSETENINEISEQNIQKIDTQSIQTNIEQNVEQQKQQEQPKQQEQQKKQDLQNFVTQQEIINISECSDEFMKSYFNELNTLNENINKQDEETQKKIKSNMLIVTSKEEDINSYGATQTIKSPNNQFILVYENEEQMEQAKVELNKDEKILDVDNNNIYEITEIEENDECSNLITSTTQATTQSAYNSWGIEATGLDTASNTANTKELDEVVVAIIDTGCDLELLESNYPDKLKGTYDVLGGTEFTDEVGHGTHIAGTIAEATPNNVKIYPIKVSESGTIYDSDIILAINYITYNNLADVINMSFGGYHKNESMYTAIVAANSENIICVAAAGNDNTSTNCYPASYDNTISVAACTKTFAKASFSNYSDTVTFTAPGVSIVSINGTSSGTSMATPHVVSAVAIYKSYNKDYTLENIIDALKQYCTDLGDEGKDKEFGYGLINLKDITYCTCNCNSCDEIYCLGCDCTSCLSSKKATNNKTVSTIEIVQPTTVLTYNYGSITNLSNIKVNIQYTDGLQEQINLLELEDCQITGYDPYSYENQTITVTYKEATTTFDLNIESEYELGWTYELNGDNTIKLTGFKTSSDMGKIILYIPEKIDDYIVTELGENLFYEQENLNKVIITSNVTKIDEYAFYNCGNLKYVKAISSELYILNHAFDNCTRLQEAEISSEELYISDYGFNNCTTLESTIKEIKQLGENAFYQCYKLSTIELASGITCIGKNALSYTAITTIEIPEGVETIKDGAFNSCYSLEDVKFPETLKTIETKAFYECTNISTLEIPSNVTSISEDSFAKCSYLLYITVDESNTTYDSRESCRSIIETETNKLIVGSNNTTIPEDIEIIGANAFNGRINLASIEIPDGVTTIEEKAFANCIYLQIATIPSSVTSIEADSFANCSSLVMYVYSNSYAEQYAIDNSIKYRYIDRTISNIYLYNYTAKTYKAFEKAAMDGVILGVVFNDDSIVYIEDGYVIEYQTGNDSFRYGDTKFTIYYNKNGIEFRASLGVTVEKATPSYTIPTGLTAKIGQSISEIALPDGFEWMDTTIIFTEEGNKIYKAKYTPEDTKNYEIEENIEIAIEVSRPAPTKITEINGITKTTYTAFETVNESKMYIKVLYETGITEEITSGFEIKYVTASDSFRYGDTKYIVQYEESGVVVKKEVAVTVNKATPSYTIPTGLTAKRGQKLSEIILPTGFTWIDSTTIISETGIKTFKAKFTPTDTTNYKTVENISITISVTKEDQTITIKNLTSKGSLLYGFKVKTVDLNNNVISSYKVSNLSKNIILSDNLIYEVYNTSNQKLSANSDITTGCKINIYSQPTSTIKELIRTYYVVIYGDTNCDGIINSGDLLTIKKHLLGTKPISNDSVKEAADINQDGTINSADLLLLKKHLLGKQIISQNQY